jgi:hypothetical protein
MSTEGAVMPLFASVGGERYKRKFLAILKYPFVGISFLLFQLLKL